MKIHLLHRPGGEEFLRFLTFFATLTKFCGQVLTISSVYGASFFREYCWGDLPFFTELQMDILLENFAWE